MKLKKLVCALGVLALSVPALALVPQSVDPVNGVVPDFEINLAGATASDSSIENLVRNELCDAGSDIDTFRDNGSNPGSAYRAIFCPMSNVPGIPAGSKVLVRKRSAGGSATGVGPVCDRVAQAYMKLQPTCTETAPGSGEWRCPNTASDQENLISEIGVSDVGPGEVQASASANCSSPGGSFALVFGVPVTTKLRNALQAAQGLVVGDESAANVPSLSYDQVRSIYTGRINTWDDFKVRGQTLAAIAAANGAAAPGGTNPNRVTICRRVDTSGTFAAFALHILSRTCQGATPLAHALNNNITGPTVLLNSGSGNVETCLDTLNNTGTIAGQTGITVPGGAGFSDWAIGMQSTEFNASRNFNYRFVRLAGELPTIDNAAAGTYSYVLVSTIQQSTTFPPSAASTSIYNALLAAVTPANLAQGNASFVHSWGRGGALALATNGFAIDPTNDNLFDPAHPVWPYMRSTSGSAPFAVNNCVGPYLVPGSTGGGGETQLGPNGHNALRGE